MKEIVEILIYSKNINVAIICATFTFMIKLILTIWKVIKENKVIQSIQNDKDIEEIIIDKTGIVIKKKATIQNFSSCVAKGVDTDSANVNDNQISLIGKPAPAKGDTNQKNNSI
jgi:hypothetical protein